MRGAIFVIYGAIVMAFVGCARSDFREIDFINQPPAGLWNGEWTLSTPEPVVELNSIELDAESFVTPDGLTFYFASNRSGLGGTDNFRAIRGSTDEPFGTPVPQEFNSSDQETMACLVGGSTIVSADWPGQNKLTNLFIAHNVRPTRADFSEMSLSTDQHEYDPKPSADGLRLYYVSGNNIWVSERGSTKDDFPSGVLIAELSSEQADGNPSPSSDGRFIVFASARATGDDEGGLNLWWSGRPTTDQPFSAPRPLAALNTAGVENDPHLTSDGVLYFSSDRPGSQGGRDIFRARFIPTP